MLTAKESAEKARRVASDKQVRTFQSVTEDIIRAVYQGRMRVDYNVLDSFDDINAIQQSLEELGYYFYDGDEIITVSW